MRETDEPWLSKDCLSMVRITQNPTGPMNKQAAPPLARWWAAGSCMLPKRCFRQGSLAGSLRRMDTRCVAPAQPYGGRRRKESDGSGGASRMNSPGRLGTRCGCAQWWHGVLGIRSAGTDSRSCSHKAAGRAARDSPRSSRSGKARSGYRVFSPSSAAGSSPCQTCPQMRGPASNSCLSCPLRFPWESWRNTHWETNCAWYYFATLFYSSHSRRTWRWCIRIFRWAFVSCRGCPWWPWQWEPRMNTAASADRSPPHLWAQRGTSWSWCPRAALPGRRGIPSLHPWLRYPLCVLQGQRAAICQGSAIWLCPQVDTFSSHRAHAVIAFFHLAEFLTLLMLLYGTSIQSV